MEGDEWKDVITRRADKARRTGAQGGSSMSVGKTSSAAVQEQARRLALSFTASLMIEAI